MRNFVNQFFRYIKLPFKLLYLIICNIIFFLGYIYFIISKSGKSFFRIKYNKKSVLCVSHVAISFDGRIKKCANQIDQLGYEVVLMKPFDAQESLLEERSGLRDSIVLKKVGLSGVFDYFPRSFDLLMFLEMIFSDHKYIHCHDINTAFMGLLATKISGKILISDLHELKSETFCTSKKRQNRFQKKIFIKIEKAIAKKSDFVITVNELIAAEIKKIFHRDDILIVKNSPISSPLESYNLKKKLNISENSILGIWIGQIAPYRNIEPIIEAIKDFQNIYLVFQGTIDKQYLEKIKDKFKQNKFLERVFFLPPVSYDLISSACQGADFGIFTCLTQSKSMNYSLPNKIFEYIDAEIPILSEDIPLMRSYIEKHDIGVLMYSNNPESVRESLKKISTKTLLNTKKKNVSFLKNWLIPKINHETEEVYKFIYSNDSN